MVRRSAGIRNGFATLGRALHAREGMRVVLVGANEDREASAAAAFLLGPIAVDLTGGRISKP